MIFISYAHTPSDEALARYICHGLRAAGLEVWLDEERMPIGAVVPEQIRLALEQAEHAIFLISGAWLDRQRSEGYTRWELETFRTLKPDPSKNRRLVVFRAPREELKLQIPPHVLDLNALLWTDEEPSPEARMYELYSAITGRPPGAPDAFAEEWRRVAGDAAGAPPLPARPGDGAAARPQPFIGQDRPSLLCNRKRQWATIETLMRSPRHEVIIIGGPTGQAHNHFIQRIERLLPNDPARSILAVSWGRTRPVGEGAYREALATNLATTPGSLAAALRTKLSHRNLVLVHDAVRDGYDDEDLVAYYTRWLPGLLEQARSRSLKCIQAVEWPTLTLVDRLLGWSGTPVSSRAAQAFIEALEATPASEILRVVRLPDLQPISQQDLLEFCKECSHEGHREGLLALMRRTKRTSAEILDAIDRHLTRARQPDDAAVLLAAV